LIFLLGICAHQINQQGTFTNYLYFKPLGLILTILGVISTYKTNLEYFKFGTFLIPGFFVLILSFNSDKNKKRNNYYILLGSLVYSFYITQWLWIGIARDQLLKSQTVADYFAWVFITILVFTFLSYLFQKGFIEPIRKFGNSYSAIRIYDWGKIILSIAALTIFSFSASPYLTPEKTPSLSNIVLTNTKITDRNDSSISVSVDVLNKSTKPIFIHKCDFTIYDKNAVVQKFKYVRYEANVNDVLVVNQPANVEMTIKPGTLPHKYFQKISRDSKAVIYTTCN